MYGQVIAGRWYDTGNPADYLIAQFASAMANPDYGPLLRQLVRDLSDIDRPNSFDTTA
ncbi:hypothetical protein [Nonomuraea dietziae]|uniref:UTP-glucose-1-phosphate uridylyltransferase n=1 Tax=Nonomuraea dietziae TaxID=65515 RepID=A0A7W5VDL4_9ACTN|nr:hypothetical protein [Nonomuraea dietziae]MBB3734099.1 UTP-glucose-1-phosphate uridylyltransferase [Nonomuraea dietziae]